MLIFERAFRRAGRLLAVMAGLLGLSLVGCGGSGDDDDAAGAFKATEPPDDVCGLLDYGDVATVLPKADRATPDQVEASADIWVRSCSYGSPDSALSAVDLVLEGAISKAGDDLIRSVVDAGPGDGLKQHVDGVGESATYWADDDLDTLGLVAAWRGYGVGVTAYRVDPPPTKDQLVPLVVKVIGKLPQRQK